MSTLKSLRHREKSSSRLTRLVVRSIVDLFLYLPRLSTPWLYLIVAKCDKHDNVLNEDVWGYAYVPVLLSRSFVTKEDFINEMPQDDAVEWGLPSLPSKEIKEISLPMVMELTTYAYDRFKQYKGLPPVCGTKPDWQWDQLALVSVIMPTLFSTPRCHGMTDATCQSFVDKNIIPFEIQLFTTRLKTLWSSKLVDIAFILLEQLTTPILVNEAIFRGLSTNLDRPFFVQIPFEFALKTLKHRNCVLIDGYVFLGYDEIYNNIGQWYGQTIRKLYLTVPIKEYTQPWLGDERAAPYVRAVRKLLNITNTIPQQLQPIKQTNVVELKKNGPLCVKKMISALEKDIAHGADAKAKNQGLYLTLDNRLMLVNVLYHTGVPSDAIEALLHERIDRVYKGNTKGEKKQTSALVHGAKKYHCYGCTKIIQKGWCGFDFPEIEEMPQRLCAQSIKRTETIKTPKHYIEIK